MLKPYPLSHLTPGGSGAGIASRAGYRLSRCVSAGAERAPAAFPAAFNARRASGLDLSSPCIEPKLSRLRTRSEATKKRVPPAAALRNTSTYYEERRTVSLFLICYLLLAEPA